jgi:peptide/nickel transport system substrate-binding protein
MRRAFAALALCLAGAAAAAAQDVTIGVASRLTSLDPHFHNASENNAIAFHFFDPLVQVDATQRLRPGLAEGWTAIGDTAWEFTLREGLRFQDGTPLTTDDVVFTLARLPRVPNSPASFASYVQPIIGVEVVDERRIRFRTADPVPLLPTFLSTFAIVSRRHGEGATTADYNAGRALVGTGPYRMERYVPGEVLVLQRNDTYWGGAEPWRRVSFRVIGNDSARMAALLAGDVDFINNVPPLEVERLSRDARFAVFRSTAASVYYIHLDRHRAVSPHFTDKAGRPLPANPLNDLRVRRAMSLALNRDALVERIMGGVGEPAGQIVSAGFFGHSPALGAGRFDPNEARRLLTEAGYPDGFAMTLHGPNDRYPNADRMLQAMAQMFARIGIETRAEAMPASVLFTRGTNLEFSLVYLGAANFTGEVGSLLSTLLGSHDRQTGRGSTNRGRYANPALDVLLARAFATLDDAQRERLLIEAQEIAIGDVGLIPVMYPVNVWAGRRGLHYAAHAEARTYAMRLRPR